MAYDTDPFNEGTKELPKETGKDQKEPNSSSKGSK